MRSRSGVSAKVHPWRIRQMPTVKEVDMGMNYMPFTSSVESVSVSRLRHSVTTKVKFVDAVCPAEFTVTVGV